MTETAASRRLEAFDIFRDLDTEERTLLADLLEQRQLAAGEVLFEHNAERRALYLVVEGEIELLTNDPYHGDRRLVKFEHGDFLAESALLEDSHHTTVARALAECLLLEMPRERFFELARERPTLANRILVRLARSTVHRMQHATARAIDTQSVFTTGQMRLEKDLLGTRELPQEVYYGIQTLRAVENFAITGVRISHYPLMVKALALVKIAATRANHQLGHLPDDVAYAIERAGSEVARGDFLSSFVVDVIQGGAGTSTNMNANEVIANRANELLGGRRGDYHLVHPNNHVNRSQSTNDTYPTAIKIALIETNELLVESLRLLIASFRQKATEFADVLKMGRTQLQDAVPMTLGQGFEAYAVTLGEEIERLRENARLFLEINLGGTAIGTGITADVDFGPRAIDELRQLTGLDLVAADNLVEATQDTGSFVIYSSALKRLAVKLSKICNDLRLLSSGPRAGFNEINLPPMQPGSSIMPGKVNPVIPEVVNQIAFKVIGNDVTVTMAAEAGQLELNVMEPVIAQSIFESIEILRGGIRTLDERCVRGIEANVDVCQAYVRRSIGLVTALVPRLGYEKSTQLAKRALAEDRGIYGLVLEEGLMSEAELERLLDPRAMVRPAPDVES